MSMYSKPLGDTGKPEINMTSSFIALAVNRKNHKFLIRIATQIGFLIQIVFEKVWATGSSLFGLIIQVYIQV